MIANTHTHTHRQTDMLIMILRCLVMGGVKCVVGQTCVVFTGRVSISISVNDIAAKRLKLSMLGHVVRLDANHQLTGYLKNVPTSGQWQRLPR